MQRVIETLRQELTDIQRHFTGADLACGTLREQLASTEDRREELGQYLCELAAAIVLLEDAPPGATTPAGGQPGSGRPEGASGKTLA